MFQKWTPSEDEELKKLVFVHGGDWHKIQQFFSSKRTRNALIKRWHSQLKKYSEQILDDIYEKQLRIQEKTSINENSQTITSKRQSTFIKTQQEKKPPAKQWTKQDDDTLKSLVLDHYEYDWSILAQKLQVSQSDVKSYWKLRIYPFIKSSKKIAGSQMWTEQEDQMIQNAAKKAKIFKWQQLLQFLPERSYFSLQARWKRVISDRIIKKTQLTANLSSSEIREINHRVRVREYRNILKLRKKAYQRSKGSAFRQKLSNCD